MENENKLLSLIRFLIFIVITDWIIKSFFENMTRLFSRDASPTERLTILSAYSLLSLGVAWVVFFFQQ